MAWRFKVASKTKNPDQGSITVAVDYYDDVDPATVIVRRQFPFPAYFTTSLMQSEIKHEGVKERERRNAVDTLYAAIPDNYDAPV